MKLEIDGTGSCNEPFIPVWGELDYSGTSQMAAPMQLTTHLARRPAYNTKWHCRIPIRDPPRATALWDHCEKRLHTTGPWSALSIHYERNTPHTLKLSISAPMTDRESASPPRKRPRTRAPPQAATSKALTDLSAPRVPPTAPESPSTNHCFQIQPTKRFGGGASASIKRPREIAHFSYDDHHEYRHDDSSINYYVPPPIGADLKDGFATFRHYEDKEDPHLDSLLRALVDTEKNLDPDKRTQADFVTWRGMMTKVR